MAEQATGASYQRLSSMRSEIEKITFGPVDVIGEVSDGVNSIVQIEGKLTLVERPYGVFVEFNTVDTVEKSMVESTWEMPNVNGSESTNAAQKLELRKRQATFSLDMKDMRSFKLVECLNPPETCIRFHAKDGTSYTPLRIHSGKSSDFVTHLQRYITLKRSTKDDSVILVTDEKTEALQASVSLLFKERSSDFVSRFWSDPYSATLTGLSKVSNFLQDQVRAAMLDLNELDENEQKQCIDSLRELQKRDEDAQFIQQQEPGDFEMITKLEFPARPIVPRNEALTPEEWASFKNPDGSFSNVRELKFRIFRGGLSHELRPEAWKYLLGHYDWNWTKEKRDEIDKQRKDDYYRMKLQWRTISEDQEKRFGEYRDRKALIEKDVTRTDRNHRFYEGEHNTHLDTLTSILLTYVMYNFDIGYVQGMSDLLSPILVVMENEVDSFWAFVGFMNKVSKNFEMDQKNIKMQLMQLRDLIVVVNPKLANYLESHDSDNMYFCFRWILVLFKREFGFSDIMRLWEVLWTELPCKNFHLLICLAILDMQSVIIMDNKYGFTEILKNINDLSMHIPLEEALKTAEGIFHQMAAVQDKLPSHICEILGFQSHTAITPVISPITISKPAPGMAQRKMD